MSRTREDVLLALYEHHQRGAIMTTRPSVADRVDAIIDRLDEIDGLIEDSARNWRLGRMALVDVAVLRLATYELLADADTPTAVILNEAVELAKRFSTEHSGAFVNGVLSAIAEVVRGDRA